MAGSRPGPDKRVSREALIDAGVRAVQQRLGTQQRLDDVFGVRLREITTAADAVYRETYGREPTPPISSAAIYREWPDKEEFLRDVFLAMFRPPPRSEATGTLLQEDVAWEDALATWLDSDQGRAVVLGPEFLLAFPPAAAGDPVARDALGGVYDGFDELLVPILRQFLEQHGLQVELPTEADDPDGVSRLARMLTAITEGWFLRSIAQPQLKPSPGQRSPWTTQAVLTVGAVTSTKG